MSKTLRSVRVVLVAALALNAVTLRGQTPGTIPSPAIQQATSDTMGKATAVRLPRSCGIAFCIAHRSDGSVSCPSPRISIASPAEISP